MRGTATPSVSAFTPAGEIPRIALMLPLGGAQGAVGGNDFTELYRGVLLGLEDLKSRGASLDVVVYDTAGSSERVFNIVIAPEFLATDLIIGPVYEREMGPAVQFAELMTIPIVSPLAAVHELDSRFLYQMAPDPEAKYDKLEGIWGRAIGGAVPVADIFASTADVMPVNGGRDLSTPVTGRRNVILVSSATGNDAEFEREMEVELQGVVCKSFTIGDEVGVARGVTGEKLLGSAGDIASLVDWDAENIFVVLGEGELAVQRALATISSSYANASARLGRRADIKVLGSSRWVQYGGVDRNLFFRLGVRFVTSYYIDRSNERVRRFEERFLAAYGELPTRSAFRGYDAVVMFGGALYGGDKGPPLQVEYRFEQPEGLLRHVNREWTMVEFTPDFNVIVK